MRHNVRLGSRRVFMMGAGMTGKTTILRELWLNRDRRALVLDVTGEYAERPPAGARIARDWDHALVLLRQVADKPRWCVIAPAGMVEPQQVAGLFIPQVRGAPSYSAAVGGMTLYCSELEEFAGQGAPLAVKHLWTRGRHFGLSIVGDCISPHLVARAVTGNSQWIVVTQLMEPRDLEYLGRRFPRLVRLALPRVPRYGALLWNAPECAGYIIDRHHQPIEKLSLTIPAVGGGFPADNLAG